MTFQCIQEQVQKGGEISPFLFVSYNLELLHAQLESYILNLFQQHSIDAQSLFYLRDTGESVKIEEVKQFIAKWDIRARFDFQVFFIENINQMTPQAANACLKFFEEPGPGNIIILTNQSESGVIDTILSRVQLIHIEAKDPYTQGNTKFYKSMIESHRDWSSNELVRYFFSGKYEKSEYTNFLYALIEHIADSWRFASLLDEIHEDIWGILKNNLQGKYVVDKYIMLLQD